MRNIKIVIFISIYHIISSSIILHTLQSFHILGDFGVRVTFLVLSIMYGIAVGYFLTKEILKITFKIMEKFNIKLSEKDLKIEKILKKIFNLKMEVLK